LRAVIGLAARRDEAAALVLEDGVDAAGFWL
jgi:hypothetical protein